MESPKPRGRRVALGPGTIAATSFAFCDVFAKVVFAAGSDVLTLALSAALSDVVILYILLAYRAAAEAGYARVRARSRWRSACCSPPSSSACLRPSRSSRAHRGADLFRLSAAHRHRRLDVRRRTAVMAGALAADVAFCGLALMIGAYPQHLSTLGIAFALGRALPRGVSSRRPYSSSDATCFSASAVSLRAPAGGRARSERLTTGTGSAVASHWSGRAMA